MPKTLMGFYWEMLKEHKWYSIILCTLRTASLAIGVSFYPFIIGRIYSIFDYKGPDFWNYALGIIMLALGVQLGRKIIQAAANIYENKRRPYVRINISEKLFARIYGADYRFFLDKNIGSIQSQENHIYAGFHPMTITLIYDMLGLLIGLGLIFGMLLEIDMIAAILILTTGAAKVAWQLAIRKKSARLSAEAAKSGSKASGIISDSILNFANIKMFASARRELKYVRGSRLDAAEKNWKESRFIIGAENIFWFFDVCVMWIGVIAYGAYLFSENLLNVAGFALIISSFNRFENESGRIANIIKDTTKAYADAKQAWDEIMVPQKIKDKSGAKDLVITRGRVDMRGISFRYHKEWVVRDMSLKINPGEKIGIVGASGAGKTTLSQLILRLFDVQKGAIMIDGQNIKNVRQDSLRSQIAFVPQDPALFNRTIGENIAYARPDASKAEIEHAAKLASIHDFIIGTEKGYDTIVGNRGIKLSGGQRQRIAIARAILKNSKILILDEATSALDSETETAVQKSFGELMKGSTVIAVAHRLSTLRQMDKIVVMENGLVAEQGAHAELLKKRGGIYARMWKMQSGGFV
ncbi:MAG: ABC transporter ATP-binding protein/permease [Rickettsiales bacterium]|jgi:ABC-type multidrug transport system fused ATPase/permease subunit|nr:ABC transporter ATP-binding protein/permease [Rickettsiales bacterium]